MESDRSQSTGSKRNEKRVFIQSSLVICVFKSISVQRGEFTVRNNNTNDISLERGGKEKLMKIDVLINLSHFELIFIC